MTEVLVGLIALIPYLLGLAGSRRRRLSTIKAELEIHAALGKSFPEAKKVLHRSIARDVRDYASYNPRQARFDQIVTAGPLVGWLLLVLGFSLYEGTITDPETLEGFRQSGGSILMIFGGGIVLLSFGLIALLGFKHAQRNWLRLRLWRKDRQIAKLQAHNDAVMREIATAEAQIRGRGGEPPPMPPQMRKRIDELVEREGLPRVTPPEPEAAPGSKADS